MNGWMLVLAPCDFYQPSQMLQTTQTRTSLTDSTRSSVEHHDTMLSSSSPMPVQHSQPPPEKWNVKNKLDFYKPIGTTCANNSTNDYGKCLPLLCQANDLCTTDIRFPANLTTSSSLTTGNLDQDLVWRFGPPPNNNGFHRNPPYLDPDSDAVEFISTAPPSQQWWSQPRDRLQMWPCSHGHGIPMEAALVSPLFVQQDKAAYL